MQTFRGNVTRLRKLISSSLPDGDDIYGYAGISKKSLDDAIDVTYSISHLIDDFDPKFSFEIVAFKRFASTNYQSLKKLLEGDEDLKKKQFDRFLTTFSGLIEKTKVVHYVVKGEGFRNEIEIGQIIKDLDTLRSFESSFVSLRANIDQTLNEGKQASQELIAEWEACEGTTVKIQKILSDVTHSDSIISAIHENVEEWRDEIAERRAEYITTSSSVETILKDLKNSKTDLDIHIEGATKIRSTLEELSKSCIELEKKTRSLLGDANRIEMGHSFKARKDSLSVPHYTWGAMFIISLLGLVIFSQTNLLPEFKGTIISWPNILAKGLFTFPLVWMAWFSARQYSQISKLREDYAFKEATAMAFEGHRSAAREVDELLEYRLLECCIANMSSNPIRLLGDKLDPGSPVHEALDGLLDRFKNVKRASVKTPGGTEVEVEQE